MPLAVKTTPVMSATGPLGRWLPGIHSGVVRVMGPGCDGEIDLGVVELARGLGEVGGDVDGGLAEGGDVRAMAAARSSGVRSIGGSLSTWMQV